MVGSNAETVLIVDDDESMRELVALVLREDYTVLTAYNARAALAILSAKRVALVITDLSMPGDSGLDLVREIRTRYAHTRTILMSAYPEVVSLAQTCGADRWFVKGSAPVQALRILAAELLTSATALAPREH